MRTVHFVLSEGMNSEGQLFRVKKDFCVHFVLDATLVGKRVRFFTNYPTSSDPTFSREKYRELAWTNPTLSNQEVDCFDNHFELFPLCVSGSFHFYFTTDVDPIAPTSGSGTPSQVTGSGYLTVDPHFGTDSVGVSAESLAKSGWDLDGVVLQTYLSKNLGYFDEWDSRLMAAKEGNYNMIHFTPFQELGYSGSAYSLRDQLKVNPSFTRPKSAPIEWPAISKFLNHLEVDWSILSMTDLVFNHTSNDSPWLHEHPECAYNVVNSPHLVPAYLLDFIICQMSAEAARGSLASHGIPATLRHPSSELPAIRSWLSSQIEAARLHEFFLADTTAVEKEFVSWLLSTDSSIDEVSYSSNSESLVLKVAGKRKGRRFGSTVDFELARKMFVGVTDHSMPLTEAAAISAANRLKIKLEELNATKACEIATHLQAAMENVLANARYRFYDDCGPKLGKVTADTPIMLGYFYQPVSGVTTLKAAEAVLNSPHAARVMAFNGWVMNDNPLRNFAEPDSYVYLRRELIVWGDSVKLRYGEKRDDCPYLWDRMAKYSEITASMFHAVRLDNCHSTPLHVAQYMLDKARAVRPNLYVVAELFTNSEYQDNIFINKLGLNSLIRETLQVCDANALGAQLYRYGVPRPTGAFFTHIFDQRLYPSVAHALLYDQTHDNPSVAEKHCVFDYLPLAALTSIACCAIGSTRGVDELVPHYIDVVKEDRPYAKWPAQVNQNVGFVEVKSILNELHKWLAYQGFSETFVDQHSPHVIAVTRVCPATRESVILVAHTAFSYDVVNHDRVDFDALELSGRVNRLLLETRTVCADNVMSQFKRNPSFINGLQNVQFPFLQNVDFSESRMFRVEHITTELGDISDRVHFHSFPPGAVVVISVRLSEQHENALGGIHTMLSNEFGCTLHKQYLNIKIGHGDNAYTPHLPARRPSLIQDNTVRVLADEVNLLDLNRILFRCEAEERSDDPPGGAYHIPGYGKLCYCGFESITALMEDIRDKHDLGHPICAHLREGDWLPDYLVNRLCTMPKNAEHVLSTALNPLGMTLKMLFSPLHHLPPYLKPAYFATLIQLVTDLMHNKIISHMAPWITSSSSLIKRLAVASNQFYGFIGNCLLPGPAPLVESIIPPELASKSNPTYCSLAAGLPHFAEGMWRCWGRDTFISLRGCLLITERFEDAADVILSYASLVRHGLIPNLTGEGHDVHPRYNCRDAVWYWMYSIVCYEKAIAKAQLQQHPRLSSISAGHASDKQDNTNSSSVVNKSASVPKCTSPPCGLVHRPIWRWFPTDDAIGWPDEKPQRRSSIINRHVQPVHEVIQEVLQLHITGIDFVERNAGPQLDEQMKLEGFRVTACVDPQTGFPAGGNAFNCGTWMDKMGSSDLAGNRGIPATPRDGSAVELIGLAYAVVEWLNEAHQTVDEKNNPYYPHSGVQLPDGKFFTWSDWLTHIQSSFEPLFWIPSDTKDPALMYNRGIYRDSIGSSSGFTDNQLRPNFLITMVVAPSLFTPERAWTALEVARTRILGPYGMRTLGPNDMAYRGDYHNSVDSTDYSTARGFNYHQGPEWLWPTGYYLRARLYFARLLSTIRQDKCLLDAAISECQNVLARFDKLLRSTPWRSLPELTNSNGQYCPDSSAAQAWSVGCAMEAAYDLLALSTEK
ncbi:unnamed protein product [Dicrocoelium dendriticum]|nr:unnamed protein product [Dicrocoelium dendriticum]